MKKFLSLFAIMGLSASTSTIVVSCGEKDPNIVKIYDYNGKLVDKIDKSIVKGWTCIGIGQKDSSYLVITFIDGQEEYKKEYGLLAGEVDWWNVYLFKLIWNVDIEI
ncbi:Vmc-like lipoprotein signal peptide domain-containing protein [Spiroplasma cantharicola]|uniref:Lipoprotein n=1 Tax=Spiroplasma cantharicola TaxID=362837 RepID=A0A0M5KCM7_9MOLU|nr:hypothetical protein [Spiroplasma cantharicola]ALD66656.1 hypothetical protein SCANT_v1c07500 [Spiroplasma cantharicola]